MLFNLIVLILVAYAVVSPFFYIKFGINIVSPAERKAKPKRRKSQPMPMTEDEKRTLKILANIDSYDGTSNGQVKIERDKL